MFSDLELQTTCAEVVLPLALGKMTYAVPPHLRPLMALGLRVEVPFQRGNKRYAGLVYRYPVPAPKDYELKPILEVLDDTPIVQAQQLDFWTWLADYYLCTLGEVMQAALPAGLKLSADSYLSLNPEVQVQDWSVLQLEGPKYALIQALSQGKEQALEQLQRQLKLPKITKIVAEMVAQNLILVRDQVNPAYKAKTKGMVALHPKIQQTPLNTVLSLLGNRSERQMKAFLAVWQLSQNKKQTEGISRQEIYELAKCDSAVLRKLADKELLHLYEEEISRLESYQGGIADKFQLAPPQEQALAEIEQAWQDKTAVLLHGVTGSGKTQVFVELMRRCMARGEQVLYLLPEIALTAQIVNRLRRQLGDEVLVYHSKFNNMERVEVWRASFQGRSVILGARSAVFLPFERLGLIIIDEEHDPSYKQQDPAPRYNARDAALYLARLHGAKVVLGTATPSLESWYNAYKGLYGLVNMNQRYGGSVLPRLELVGLAEAKRKNQMKSHFSQTLLSAMKDTLAKGEQIILFQNRRGYAPIYVCQSCGWRANCHQCDVSLTYHKYKNNLNCHYCSYEQALPRSCPSCKSTHLIVEGFGTEKIEDELEIYLPEARVARMDFDTVKGKDAHAQIIERFERGAIQILVGTQMVTKGLDFDKVGLVGVLSADSLLYFPDFRASERAYQLLLQVSGRAGRKQRQGRVIIQALRLDHEVLREVQQHDFNEFIRRELRERGEYAYPPFIRLIKIQIRHPKQDMALYCAQFLADYFQPLLGEAVLGPAVPSVGRVKGLYLQDLLLKLPKDSRKVKEIKTHLLHAEQLLRSKPKTSALRVWIDVDPY